MTETRRLDFLLTIEDYHGSYTGFLKKNAQLNIFSYKETARELFSKFIYYGDSYEYALTLEGFNVEQVIPGCTELQYKWAVENGISLPPRWIAKRPFCWWWTRILQTSSPKDCAKMLIVTEQIKKMRPKILWVFSGVPVTEEIISKWRLHAERIILWWACPIVPKFPYHSFDLILSSSPSLVKYFQSKKIEARCLLHAFDPRILKHVDPPEERIQKVVFAGSLLPIYHKQRIALLDYLARYIDIDFYGYFLENLSYGKLPRVNIIGKVWGVDLHRVYSSYLITIQKNIDISKNEICSKRIFEATGMGICVVTEYSEDVKKLFEPGKEIVTYKTPEECLEKIRYLLMHPQEAVQIGKRGQERTLQYYTYKHRVSQFIRYLNELNFL